MKFIPKTDGELDTLEENEGLELFEYPLDYEIVRPGSYRDNSIPKNQPTYQYTAIPVDYRLPETEYEILEELFIPEEDENLYQQYQHENYNTIDILVAESLILTDNYDYDTTEVSQNGCWWVFCRPNKWRPYGSVARWDDIISPTIGNLFVAVEGVTVRPRRWFTIKKDITDKWGGFQTGEFRGPVNYSIIWKRGNFRIKKNSGLVTATLNGPKRRGWWQVRIGNAGLQEYYANIHIAAHHYFYKDIKGLRRPPRLAWPISLKAKSDNSGGLHSAWKQYIPFLPRITISRRFSNSQEVYGTVIHELAHASHWYMNGPGDFFFTRTRVKETWARGVQWELTRMLYPEYPGGSNNVNDGYTSLVIDLIDPAETPMIPNNGLENDNVTGYGIRQLEDALRLQQTGTNWENNIIDNYKNATEDEVPALFNHWDF